MSSPGAPATPFGLPLSATWSKEFHLLCLCAQVEPSAERVSALAAIVGQNLDWKAFVRSAEFHGLLPLTAKNLAGLNGVPSDVAQFLRSAFDTNARRNLWFTGEMLRIATRFEERKIDVAPYKGPRLSEDSYGDVALRAFSDLDFLVAPRDLERAMAALGELGYHPSKQQTEAEWNFWKRYGYEASFDSAAAKYLVELQWRIAPRYFSLDLTTEEILGHSAAKESVRALRPEDTLLVLSLHAARHLWMRMIWVCDLAETIRTHNIEYGNFLERAQRLGVLRMVLINFWLVRNLLGTPLPLAVDQVLSTDPQVETLGQVFAERLSRNTVYDFESTAYFRLSARLRERRRDRARYFWRLFWTPGVSDLASLRLPAFLFPLYRIVRLFRLARRFVPRPVERPCG